MNYPSDITKEQFNKIAPTLDTARKKTRPKTLSMYEVFNGLLYVVSTGCQWRALPKDYPKWKSAHYYFQIMERSWGR
jgi:transposase